MYSNVNVMLFVLTNFFVLIKRNPVSEYEFYEKENIHEPELSFRKIHLTLMVYIWSFLLSGFNWEIPWKPVFHF